MSRSLRLVLVLFITLVLTAGTTSALTAAPTPDASAAQPRPLGDFAVCDPDGYQDSGAIYRICMPPDNWSYNGKLAIWAHGYVAYNEPLAIPEDQLCPIGETLPCIEDLATFLTFGFATTSYATNGLAVVPGMQDIVDLVNIFTARYGAPEKVYLIGASEGGIITALVVEQYSDIFSGGLALCGPVGDFNLQINYFGDFRVIFDYFFADKLDPPMGDPLNIPQWLIDDWDNYWNNTILPVLRDPVNEPLVRQLMTVMNAPYEPDDFWPTVETTIHDGLWYNVFGTNDATTKLGGQPFFNTDRIYTGSLDDAALNAGVMRTDADPLALDVINAYYQTSGVLVSPVVTAHTTRDQQVPYGHEELYKDKLWHSGSWIRHVNLKIDRYEHCNFKLGELLLGYFIMMILAGDIPQDVTLNQVQVLLPDPVERAAFLDGLAAYGVQITDRGTALIK